MENANGSVNTNSPLTTNTLIATSLLVNISSYIYESPTTTLVIGYNTTPSGQTMSESTTISHDGRENDYSYIYENYSYHYGDEYMYPGYSFERSVYLYIWEILVIFVFLVNVIVISVLLRRKMRNATNMILAAIAISDSLTGLVTLPSYIMVYQRYDPFPDYSDYVHENANLSADLNQTDYESFAYSYDYQGGFGSNASDAYQYDFAGTKEPIDGYILTKSLCRGFMISKYFLSKYFHTVSVFLTLFLCIQRYVAAAFPFRCKYLFNGRNTILWCGAIFVLSPVFHSYHLGSEKAVDGSCQWELTADECGGGCIYLWFSFFVRHLIPCATLLIFTVLLIRKLHLGERSLFRMVSNPSQLAKRVEENRRISITVTAVVIVFLIPEIPYGIFLLYNLVAKSVNNGKDIHLGTNRAIHMSYEVSLLLSFHANIYVYTFLNKRFRRCLYSTFFKPFQKIVGGPRRLSISRLSSASNRTTIRKADCPSSKDGQELHFVPRGTRETRFMESISVDITLSSHPECHEFETLNAKV
ncbi:uncharacterized protein LOC128548575 [Mercenaria mercenaria]|uniref:uncharacterized protein LOC128548575 n=1 Tax=Mercenaria mercenaria TaxID=6596 RepID=UPI00234F315D|nr:uncharacterized protein LOC128548575 [Mercenaria mercenaria]XP_053379813.1 uncharacterized protein LOC128548575 [Mercenaria mercenaria]